MTRKILKRLLKTYKCLLLPDNTTFEIDSEEATISLTPKEVELLRQFKKDKSINKELESILSKLTELFYLGEMGNSHYLYILTPALRSAPTVMRTFIGVTGKTMSLSKAEYEYLCELMGVEED